MMITAMDMPQLSSLSLRASLMSVRVVKMENAGLFEKMDELREGLKRTKRNEKGEKWLRFGLSWLNVVVYTLSIVYFTLLLFNVIPNIDRYSYDFACFVSVIGCISSLPLLLYELHIKGLDAWLRPKCRFLFTYIGRALCLLMYTFLTPLISSEILYSIMIFCCDLWVYREYDHLASSCHQLSIIAFLLNLFLPLFFSICNKEITLLSDPSPDYPWNRPVPPSSFPHPLEENTSHNRSHHCILPCFFHSLSPFTATQSHHSLSNHLLS